MDANVAARLLASAAALRARCALGAAEADTRLAGQPSPDAPTTQHGAPGGPWEAQLAAHPALRPRYAGPPDYVWRDHDLGPWPRPPYLDLAEALRQAALPGPQRGRLVTKRPVAATRLDHDYAD